MAREVNPAFERGHVYIPNTHRVLVPKDICKCTVVVTGNRILGHETGEKLAHPKEAVFLPISSSMEEKINPSQRN
ncbi:2577_t:CDS:2 [Funneliformis mosseae]|uniref:2577_t:CDS:1 n=1 Tax=Funneliformis mosseae TaxID=27381 RepID=A0A9N9HKQ5_FUNMO|nr:2577_t:CDS:2 [Funneliformis mosseae]